MKSHFTYHFYSNSRDLENNGNDINKKIKFQDTVFS